MASENRESLASRLGFLLVSAGCAIGLGNVWRFPYITGEYGGAWFVLLFVVCTFAVMPELYLAADQAVRDGEFDRARESLRQVPEYPHAAALLRYAQAAAGAPFHFASSAEMNSACGKVLAEPKRLSAGSPASHLRWVPNSVLLKLDSSI